MDMKTEAALVCMIVSNPTGGERPRGWQKRVNDFIRAQRDALDAALPHEYTMSTEAQRVLDAARTAPQWDTAQDRLAPGVSAAAIEQLQADLDGARKANRELVLEVLASSGQAQEAYEAQIAAEAEIERLRAALTRIGALDDNAECCGHGVSSDGYAPPECCGSPTYGLDRAQEIARAALEQNKSET